MQSEIRPDDLRPGEKLRVMMGVNPMDMRAEDVTFEAIGARFSDGTWFASVKRADGTIQSIGPQRIMSREG